MPNRFMRNTILKRGIADPRMPEVVNGRFQRVIRVAVSAGLLTMALTPPAVRHVHADGDRQHRHAQDSTRFTSDLAHAHVDPGTHGHRHPHNHVESAPVEPHYSRGSVDHCHIACLGFEFVLPAPASSAPSQDDRGHMAQELFPVFAANGFACGPQPAPAIAAASSFAPALPSIDGLPAKAALRIFPAGSISNHLCDTARHERSGVQLI